MTDQRRFDVTFEIQVSGKDCLNWWAVIVDLDLQKHKAIRGPEFKEGDEEGKSHALCCLLDMLGQTLRQHLDPEYRSPYETRDGKVVLKS